MKARPAILAGLLACGWPQARPAEEGPRREAVERYASYAQAARAEALRPDLCPFSPAAATMRIGTDPEALAAFVREKIAYEPYRGVARGPAGVLAAASGGDWDRAELLRALLSAAGFRARLIPVERTAAEAAAIVEGFLRDDPRRRTIPAGEDVDAAKLPPPSPILERFGIPEKNRPIHLRRSAARWRRLLDESLDAAVPEAERIERALGARKLAAWRDLGAWKAALAAGARERVLVEIAAAGGLRILSPGPEPAPADAESLRTARRLDAPPPDLVARLGIRLTLTAGGEGAETKPVVLIEWSRDLGSLVDGPPRLEIVPVDPKAAARPPTQWTKAQWYEYVSGFRQFQAILRSGDSWMGSKVFDLEGQIHSVTSDGRVEGAQQVGGAVAKGFGLFGGDEEEAPKAKTRIQALTLVLELKLPGEEPLRQERLISGDLRRDLSLVYTADILVCPGPLGPAAASWLSLDAVTANAPLLARALLSEDPRRFDDPSEAKRFPNMLHEWQLGRLGLADRILAADGKLSFLGGPAAIIQASQLQADPKAKSVSLRVALDVAFDGSLLLPRSAEGAAAAARGNLTLGAASTVLESAILRRHIPDAMARGAYPESQRARLEGIEPAAALRGADGAVEKAQPEPLAAWAIARNEAGRAIVLPRPEGAASWWSVDPSTGAAIGRGGAGEGQSAMEYLQITKMNLSNLKCMLAWANAMMFGNPRDPKAAMAWMACITGVDNPGGPIGAAGNTMGVMGYEATGGALAMMGDILGGAIDVGGMMED